MMVSAWRCLFRLIVWAARFDAADLRTPDAEATFQRVCETAAHRGWWALTVTALRELSVIIGVIALAYARRVPMPRLPRVGDSLRGFRIGVRSLLRNHPGYVAMSTLVLAVAIGVNLLVFTIVNALWIRPLPFPDPDRVVTIQNENRVGNEGRFSLDDPRLRIFEGVSAGRS
ncbi:hypothetical protein BH24ACI5_BH24ACI5_28680 [soil metagenome]